MYEKDITMLLPEIKPNIKSELEELTENGIQTGYRIIDFWRWSMSDLLSNATRGIFAEFIVLTAVGFDKEIVRDEWADHDVASKDGSIRIEVKSAAYIQSWGQNKYSDIKFNIAPPLDSETRPSDVYVFCLLKHKDQDTIDPTKLEQWEFYVIRTSEIDKLGRQKRISLNVIQRMANAIQYNQLKNSISL